jgi:O-antigen/teichoic acid export membrane protein
MTGTATTTLGSVRGFGAARNTAVLLAIRVGGPMLSMALVAVVSRALGAEDLGRYTLASAFLYFFNTVAPLGLYAIVTRDGARDRKALQALLAGSLVLGVASGLVTTAAMAVLASMLGYDPATRVVLVLASLTILPSTLVTLYEGAFTAAERMELIAASSGTDTLLKVLFGIAAIVGGLGLPGVMLAAIAARVASVGVAMVLGRRLGLRVGWAVERALVQRLATAAPTFLLIAVFATLYWRIDVLMLSRMGTVEDVGYYGAAWRLLEFAMIVPQSLCLALYPQMAGAASSNPQALGGLADTARRYLAALSLPLAVCATVVAGPVLALLYGAPFAGAAPTLVVLMWTLVPYGWVRYNAYVLVAADRQHVDLVLNVCMAAINVALNLVWIPAYGPFGAALATLVSVCAYAVAQGWYLRRYLPRYGAPIRVPPLPLAAAVATGAVVWMLHRSSLVLGCLLAPAVYGAILVAAGFFSASELRLLGIGHRPLAGGVRP